MAEVKFEIKEELGVLSEGSKGWRKELNLISWNGAAPKYDLRDWAPEHENAFLLNYKPKHINAKYL